LITTAVGTQYQIAGNNVGECVEFGSANTWGGVELYDVQLDGVTLSNFPIQQINSGFEGGPPSSSICSQAGSVSGPTDPNANFNGILGIGLGTIDHGNYYSCTGANNCHAVTVPSVNQVQNPVPNLPVDNNGVLLEMPAIPSAGQNPVTGYLAFGIGTAANNHPSSWGVTNVYQTDGYGFIRTVYNSQSYDSFIDSGSNANFVPDCFSATGGFLAPSCAVNVSATNSSVGTSTSSTLFFQIGNFNTLAVSGNFGFNNLAGTTFDYPGIGPVFDWGLSFFYGRTVFVGVAGGTAAGGQLGGATGPYWAY
jgi:hypothetical protein